MSVRAVTPRVPAVHGLQFYRDADHHDLANDEHLIAVFDDLYGLAEPPRRRVRGLNLSRANRARSSRAVHTPPAASGSSAARGHLPASKEQTA